MSSEKTCANEGGFHLERIDMTARPITFYVDSADRESAERWLRTGVATGLTTNPTILRQAGAHFADISNIYSWASEAGAREVCFQTWGETIDDWYSNAMRIRDMAPTAVVKVPCTEIGARVIGRLHQEDISILMTAGYSAKQVLIASALGVKYFAPYFNRMNAGGRDALSEFRKMTVAVPQDGSGPLVMAASLKTAQDVANLVGVGIRTFTASPKVLEGLFRDDLTEAAVDVFEQHMLDVL